MAPAKRRLLQRHEKLAILEKVPGLVAEGKSLRTIAESFHIQASQITRWTEQMAELEDIRADAKSVHKGGSSIYDLIEDEILEWYYETRELGIPISYMMLARKTGELVPEFKEKNESAQYQCARRFVLSHKLGWSNKTTPKRKSKKPRDSKLSSGSRPNEHHAAQK